MKQKHVISCSPFPSAVLVKLEKADGQSEQIDYGDSYDA